MKLPHLILSVLIMCSCVYAKKKPKPPDPNLWKNELRDQELNKATCPYIALIFTRDLDIDVGNVGMNGLELYNRLKKDFKMAPFRDDNTVQPFLKMQGVNYQHIFDLSTHEVVRYPMPEAHRIAHPEAVRMTKNLISHVVETCNGRTNIVLAGFQRGVDVLRNIMHSLTEAERNEVVAREYQGEMQVKGHSLTHVCKSHRDIRQQILESCSRWEAICIRPGQDT